MTAAMLQPFRDRRYRTARQILQFVLLVTALAWLLARGTERLGYHWQWYRVPRYLFTWEDGHFSAGLLLQGLGVTFQVAAVSLVLAFIFGISGALLRLSRSWVARWVAALYVELIRSTPLLIQLFFIYFVLSPVLDISRFMSAVLALSLFEGAYASEIMRAGIVAVDKGQWEASRSLGLSTGRTYLHVILPQALRRMLPPLTSQAISLVKDSALVSTIAIYDLAMQAQVVVADTFLTFEIWFAVAAIYLAITLGLSLVVRRMERRFASV
ncbi:MAG: amino acid ABC transporter permease [Syntrophobacteraceae bacterium]|jgi:polar amino acid transport system permease protein|nr:amino acid ABC transporter permease [Syntrophobacteraceae bacterium]